MQTIKRFCLEKELGMQQRQKKQKSATILDEIRTKISVILAEKKLENYPCQSPHGLCGWCFAEIAENHIENATFCSRPQSAFVHRSTHEFRVSNHNIYFEQKHLLL